MLPLLKHKIKQSIISVPLLLKAIRLITGGLPKVLMYHRFAPPGAKNNHRVSVDEFAWQLDTIRRDFRVISLSECIEYLKLHGSWPKKSVVLTIDDGYRDMYEWAYPELLKRKMPATFFVTTRFIDGEIWLWPDRLEYAIRNTIHKFVSVAFGDTVFKFPLQDDQQRTAAWKALSDHCIGVADHERREFIKTIENILEVSKPHSPSAEYSASTWSELREMHQNGIEIASHTSNHPILSRVDPILLDSEIAGSKTVIEERLGTKIKSFCYPNGMPDDINNTVVSAVCKAGFICSVIASTSVSWDYYRIPRMGVSNDRDDFLWKIYGGEFFE